MSCFPAAVCLPTVSIPQHQMEPREVPLLGNAGARFCRDYTSTKRKRVCPTTLGRWATRPTRARVVLVIRGVRSRWKSFTALPRWGPHHAKSDLESGRRPGSTRKDRSMQKGLTVTGRQRRFVRRDDLVSTKNEADTARPTATKHLSFLPHEPLGLARHRADRVPQRHICRREPPC